MDRLHSAVGAVISLLVLGMFTLAVLMAMTHAAPAGMGRVLDILLGALASQMVTVVQFWLGSSAGSARKTELLNKS